MSIDILTNLVDALSVKDTKLFVMAVNPSEDFADFVRRLREEAGLSLKDVERNSGGEISSGYVSQIENRHVLPGSITSQKLRAYAAGLKAPEELIFAAARGKSLNGDEAVDAEMANFASRVKKLNAQKRRDFDVAWKMANELLDRLEKEQAKQGRK